MWHRCSTTHGITHRSEASLKERSIRCNDRRFVGAICSDVVVMPPSATERGRVSSSRAQVSASTLPPTQPQRKVVAEARGSTRAQVSDAVVEDFAERHEQARRLQKLQTLWGLLWHRVAAENGAVRKITMALRGKKKCRRRTLARGDSRYFPNLGGSLLPCPIAPGQHEVCLNVLMAPTSLARFPREAGLPLLFGFGKVVPCACLSFPSRSCGSEPPSICADDPATGQPRFFDDPQYCHARHRRW